MMRYIAAFKKHPTKVLVRNKTLRGLMKNEKIYP